MKENEISIENYINAKDDIMDQIDDLILELIKQRKKIGITQTQLSTRTGIPQATISRIESFSSIPTLQVILKISNALNMKLVFKKAGITYENRYKQ